MLDTISAEIVVLLRHFTCVACIPGADTNAFDLMMTFVKDTTSTDTAAALSL